MRIIDIWIEMQTIEGDEECYIMCLELANTGNVHMHIIWFWFMGWV